MPDPPGRVRRCLNTGAVLARAAVERALPFWDPRWIERLQRRRVRAIARHAYATVPFYRRAMAERGLVPDDIRDVADLAQLPLLESAHVRRHVADFLSSEYDVASLHVLESSGSSSHVRARVYWDALTIVHKLAHTARDRAVLDRLVAGGDARRRLYIFLDDGATMTLLSWWDAATMLPRAERSVLRPDQPFEAALERLRTLKPDVVFSFGSYADGFFRFVQSRGLKFPVPRVWMYGGDALDPGGRALIENEYGCTTYSTYQTVETGRLGFQCEERAGFHLNVDLCAVRLVDEQGRPVPPGQEGEVVISNLHNRAMVLLNYRLGDRAVLSREPCPCGRSLPVIDYIAGRTTEVIQLGGGREISSFVVRNLFRRELERALQVQIVHAQPGRFTWRLVPFSAADRAPLAEGLVERGRQMFGPDVDIGVEFVEAIAFGPGGKVRALVSPSVTHG